MAEPTVPALPDDPEVLRAEIERLQAENERLAALPSHEDRVARSRNSWAVVIALIAALVFAIAVPALWLNRVVFDTDTWVETVAPLAEDPAIQDAVAAGASDALISQLDAETRLAELLPAELDAFAPLLASSVENAIRSQATNIVRSEQFAELWAEINRVGHQALITAITGRDEGALEIDSGVFTLDTGELIDMIKAALVERGLGFVERIPTDRLDRQIVLYESDSLAAAGPIVDAVQAAATIIPLLGIALLIGAFALAADRRRVALWFGAAVAIGAILPLQALYLSQYAAVTQVANLSSIPTDAAQSAFDIIFRGLVTADQTLAVFGLVVWFGAVVAGPARWAVALRSGLTGGISGAASRLELGTFGQWVAARKRGLRTAGFIGAAVILVLLPAPRSIADIVWMAVALVVWLVAVEFFGAATAEAGDEAITEPGEPVPVAEDAATEGEDISTG
jgi:hypothetical protein